MEPVALLVFGLLLMYLGATGKFEAVWKAIKGK